MVPLFHGGDDETVQDIIHGLNLHVESFSFPVYKLLRRTLFYRITNRNSLCELQNRGS